MKKINLNEESYNKLKNRIINEISYGTVDKAYNKSSDMFDGLKSSFDDFYTMLNEVLVDNENPYLDSIKEHADEILDILERKSDQQRNFFNATNSVDSKKFYDSKEGEDNDMYDMDLRYLQDNYQK